MSEEKPPPVISAATEEDLEFLHNGFDEEALKQADKRDYELALNASPTPHHWRPIDAERVA